jgi:indolepyruvate ferredoxin oxidoreductase
MSSKQDTGNSFTREEGVIHIGGIDSLVRLTLDQVRSDARRGLKTGMFVSGYRGSPLGMLDAALLKQQKTLLEHHIHFVDGINEDLAATAVWGTQMLHTVGKPKFDGVTGMWYGKAPGVDRSGDALKHANYTGIGKNGGVLAVVGDDPSCKSSSLCSQSEPMLFHVGMPSLYPGNVQEILDLGLHGYQMSRLAGLWVGLKIVTNVADGSGTANVSPERLNFVTPDMMFDGKPFAPQMNLGMNVRAQALEMEQSLYTRRLEVAKRYARENKLNNVVFANPDAWLGIITAGKTYNDLRQSFLELGLDDAALRRYGIRILKMGMLFPMEPGIVREFAQGLEEIFVIEEKRPFLELFAKNVLYGMANAPRIVGKFDEHERELLPHYGEFESDVIGRALTARLSQKARIESAEAWLARLDEIHARNKLPTSARTAWYCSGCPHNSSTQAVEGSIVSAGIGCHTMAMWMDRNVVMGTHMGAEGAQWIGMAPFTGTGHIFQNMGDGTYAHSGSLAIRYCASTNANITFKVLRNAHTSMTGGQAIQGEEPLSSLVAELLANGVKKVIVTSDRPEAISGLPGGTEAWHRDRLDEAQRALAAIPGTTVLIHDQECAAELRRARSRGKAEEPVEVTVINERVCEGCGDCGVKSNCMSVEPVATEFGRKTRIHQSSCNKDFSCVKGFCPSFLTITPNPEPAAADGAKKKKKKGRIPALDRALPEPVSKVDASFGFGVHLMGIGGTGSVTVASTITAAARLEGKHAIGLDQTGLAQKGGAVISDIKITNAPFDGSNKISDGRTDLYLGFDILNATDPKNLDKCHPERTIAVVSTTQTPTGQMVSNRQVMFPATNGLTAGIDKVTRQADNVFLDGQAMAEGLFGDSMATNLFMVGVAFQAGTIPLKAESIETAIRQAGVAVEMSLASFRWGRMAVVDRAFVLAEIAKADPAVAEATKAPQLAPQARAIVDALGAKGELKRLLEVRVPELIAYQDEAYAKRYADVVKRVMSAERRAAPGRSELAEAAARYLYKLMAYKDEYEVARLHADPAFIAQLDAQFKHGFSVTYNLAPPTISRRDARTGELQKRSFGPWMLTAFRLLRKFKGLRGGALDVFGKTEERRHERQLIEDYVAQLDEVTSKLSALNYAAAVALACVPDEIRGYGHVKEKSLVAAKALQERRLSAFRNPQSVVPPQAPAQEATQGVAQEPSRPAVQPA